MVNTYRRQFGNALKPFENVIGGIIAPSGTTWNPADKSANVTLSNGNLTALSAATSAAVRANISKAAGKFYYEVKLIGVTEIEIGMGNATALLSSNVGVNNNSWAIGTAVVQGAQLVHGGTATNLGLTIVAGDIFGVAWDGTAGNLWFSHNNLYVLSGNPATGANPNYSAVSGTLFPMWSGTNAGSGTANFSMGSLAFSPPAGFSVWA